MKKHKNAGFSLVEILVSVVILAIIVGPLLHSFVTAARVNSKARSSMQASAAAQNIMEQLKSEDITDFAAAGFTKVLDAVDTKKYTYEKMYTGVVVDGKTYKVKAVLDPGGYKKEPTGTEEKYNDKNLSEIYNMDNKYDGFYIQPEDSDSKISHKFTGSNGALASMSREIEIKIAKDALGKVQVLLNIFYEYNGSKKYLEKELCLYQNTANTVTLRNVYLFFQPMYTGKESINIINEAQVPLGVYLVKQENAQTTLVNEKKYNSKVDVKEPGRIYPSGDYIPLTTLRTNLIYHTPNPALGQMTLTYDKNLQKTINTKIYQVAELVGLDSISGENTKAKDRMYQLEVIVYDENDNVLTSLTGTKQK
ncbi:MAG: type II secretion system protein [Lachnospiraceae bacterium]